MVIDNQQASINCVDSDGVYANIYVKNPLLMSGLYTTYAIIVETTNPCFSLKQSVIRRRYSEFVILHALLKKQHPTVKPPLLPGKFIFRDRFSDSFIEKRRMGLQDYLKSLCETRIYLSNKMVHLFIQSTFSMDEIKGIIKGIPSDLCSFFDDTVNVESRSVKCDTSTIGEYVDHNIPVKSTDENDHCQASTPLFNVPENSSLTLSSQSDNSSTSSLKSTLSGKKVSFCNEVVVAQVL